MAKVTIHYFTSTGNTEHAVNIIKNELTKKKFKVKIQLVGENTLPSKDKSDYHIFAFPFLGFGAPIVIRNYIKKLSYGNNAKTAILAACGGLIIKNKIISGWGGQAIQQVENLLSKKGYNVFLSKDIPYPDNWVQVTNTPDTNDIKKINANADKKVLEFTKKFINGKKDLYRCSKIHIIWTGIINRLYCFIGSRFLGKLYIADDSCNSCGICAKSCPINTIKLINKRPRWGNNCIDCNRCINICPKQAIQFSPMRGLAHLIIFALLSGAGILCIIFNIPILLDMFSKPVIILSETMLIGIYIIFLHWLDLVIIDWGVFLLEQIPLVRKIFSISWTNKFRRYKAIGFKVK